MGLSSISSSAVHAFQMPAASQRTELEHSDAKPISYSPTITTEAPSVAENKPSKTVNASSESNSSHSVSHQDSAEDQSKTEKDAEIQQVVSQLKARDQEVRTHEMAHLMAAGQYATGGIKYQYQKGPDGQQYAVGGSVGIDTSPVSGDPEATIQKAQVVQRAALAPAEPSAQDRKVASQAGQMMANARAELLAEKAEQSEATSQESSEYSTNSKENVDKQSPSSIEPNSSAEAGLFERGMFDLRVGLQAAY